VFTFRDEEHVPAAEQFGGPPAPTTSRASETRAASDYEAMLLENLIDAVIALDAAGRVRAWNRHAERVFGWRRDEVIGRTLAEAVPSEYGEGMSLDDVLARLARQETARYDVRRRTRAGEWIDFECTSVALRAADGAVSGYVSVNRDVSLRKRAEAALRASQERLQHILETLNEGIWIVDAHGTTEFLNARAAELFGIEPGEAVGRPLLDALPEPQRSGAREDMIAVRQGRAIRREIAARRDDGSTASLVMSRTPLRDPDGALRGTISVFFDVTELRRAREELQESQKLEAVGRLASGIAHEINTPIQYVGDNTHFLGEAFAAVSTVLQRYREVVRAECSPAVRDELERVEREADLEYLLGEAPGTVGRTLDGVRRVATIVRAMKEFAHPDQREMAPVDVNRALLATIEVARNEYKYVADVVTDLAELPPVTCHAGEINQVFLNVLVNAAHAIEDVVSGTHGRGEIRIATRRDGDAVVIAISDTGGGIPEEIRAKVFEPFFTTKKVGRGTGQGLAIARNAVAKHHGQLTFTTTPGAGTTFLVRLPIEPAVPAREAA
jgi:PAS domain S-box-containing protein